jgi:hypothetical protein
MAEVTEAKDLAVSVPPSSEAKGDAVAIYKRIVVLARIGVPFVKLRSDELLAVLTFPGNVECLLDAMPEGTEVVIRRKDGR